MQVVFTCDSLCDMPFHDFQMNAHTGTSVTSDKFQGLPAEFGVVQIWMSVKISKGKSQEKRKCVKIYNSFLGNSFLNDSLLYLIGLVS